nr:uncharacterized protein LOC113807725 isoform X5 [Penaeus vannamei]
MSVALQITEVVLTVIMKVPDIIRVFKELGNGKVKQEHENLAQELCALRKEHERASKTIDALVESQEQLNQTLQLLTELLIVLNSLSSRPWPDLQESIRDVLGQGGLHQDSGVRVNEAPSGLTCAVCRSTYNAHDRRPLIFSSCGHTFCEECLRTENRKSVFRCPSCRQDRDQFWTLKPNFALLDLLEAETRDDEDDEDDLKKGLRMDDDDLLSLALHMSAQEAENKEYRRQVAALLAREPAGPATSPERRAAGRRRQRGVRGRRKLTAMRNLKVLMGKSSALRRRRLKERGKHASGWRRKKNCNWPWLCHYLSRQASKRQQIIMIQSKRAAAS